MRISLEAQYAQSCRMEVAADQCMTAGKMHSVEMVDQVAEVIAGLRRGLCSRRNSKGWWTACVLPAGPVVLQGK